MDASNAELGFCDQAVSAGSHIMYLFDGRLGPLDEAAVRFAQAGVTEGDLVVLVLPRAHLDAVASALRVPDDPLASGRLLLLSSEEVYAPEGRFSLPSVLTCWHRLLDTLGPAHSIRAFGCVAAGIPRDRYALFKLMEYEQALNRRFDIKVGVCAYDVSQIPEDLLQRILASHPLIYDGKQLQRNPCYLSPESFAAGFYASKPSEFRWSADPRCCRLARRAVGEISARMPFDLEEIDDLLLAVGEAFANAIRHGSPNGLQSFIRLRVTPADDRIAIEITDEGCGIACEPTHIDWREPGGKGLFLMRSLCDTVEHFADGSGCTVRLVKRTSRGRV